MDDVMWDGEDEEELCVDCVDGVMMVVDGDVESEEDVMVRIEWTCEEEDVREDVCEDVCEGVDCVCVVV